MTNKQQYDAINTARNKVKAVLNDIVPEDEIYKDHLLNEAYVYLTKFIEACKESEE